MQRQIWRNFLSFLLVLVLTVGTVATLSMVTSAKTETASEKYSQQVREAQAESAKELSASIPDDEPSALASLIAFALIITVPGGIVLFAVRSEKKSAKNARGHSNEYALRTGTAIRNRV